MIGSRKDGTRKSVSTHRLSYELHYGEIPQGMEICHKCDNPCCINPDHLFAGTRQDNIDDRERKGRNNPPKGEKHAKAKLTELDVLTIREKRLQGVSFGKLAKEYGVCKKTIQDAVNRTINTNADLFRAMSDEEQQSFVRGFWEIEDFADWLQQPAEGDDHA